MKQSPKGPKPEPRRSARPKENLTDKAQSERFVEAARTAGIDETDEKFQAIIESILRSRDGRN